MRGDWLADQRSGVATQRILDAADDLFANNQASAVGMKEIARAAGCSRATLYRYFDNREALLTAYTVREGQRVVEAIADRVATIADPGEQLVEASLILVRMIRASPGLSSWFTPRQAYIGGQLAQRSRVIRTLVDGFIQSLGVDDQATSERCARWIMRVLTSLLVFPGRSEAEERGMLAEFVAPILIPTSTTAT
jgi:AcrR family transcriptional regulator